MATEKAGGKPGGRLKLLPISRLLPNMVTLLALCTGISSLRFALAEKWENAVICILIAAVIDGVDGRLARLLKSTSTFGAQLDSLADFVNFGVMPAIILYLWQLDEIHIRGVGWALVLFYVVCCAIRLARFNTDLEDEERPEWADRFFTGIPSPAGAGLALAPMMLAFHFGGAAFSEPGYIGVYMAAVGILMASRIPTFSMKKMAIRSEYVYLLMLGAGFFIAAVIIQPWLTLPFLGVLYLLLIPLSCISHYRYQNSRTGSTS